MVITTFYWLCVLVSGRTFIECKRNKVEFKSKGQFRSSTGLFQRNRGPYSVKFSGEMVVHTADHTSKPGLQQRTTNFKLHSNRIMRGNDRLTHGQILGNKIHKQVILRTPQVKRNHSYVIKGAQKYNRNIVIRRKYSEYPHHAVMKSEDEKTDPHNLSYSVVFGNENNAINKRKDTARSSSTNPFAWNANDSPSYISLLYKPGYNPFNMTFSNSTNRYSMPSFYNDDYDPYNSSSDYPYNKKSPFNKTAYTEFKKQFRQYIKAKFNVSIPKANKTKEGPGENKLKKGEEAAQRSLDNPDDNNSKSTYNPFVMPSFYNDDYDPYNTSSDYPYNNKSPFNKTAFTEFSKQFQEYVKEKYNVSMPLGSEVNKTKEERKAITPSDADGKDKGNRTEVTAQRSLDNPDDKPSDNKSPNTRDNNPYNSSYNFYNMPTFYNDDYDPYNATNDYPYYDYESPFNKTAFAEFNMQFQKYIQNKLNQSKPSPPTANPALNRPAKNESKPSNVTENNKDKSKEDNKDKSAAQSEFTDKEEEEDIKALSGEQTNKNKNKNKEEEENQEGKDNKQMEEATQEEPDLIDNTPVADATQIQDGLTNDSSRKCHVAGHNCTTDYSEKEMVVVLEVEKPSDTCIPTKRVNKVDVDNSGHNSPDTPVVVISDDPYKSFSKKTRQSISSMGSLKVLESLMASPTTMESRNRLEYCKATCTC